MTRRTTCLLAAALLGIAGVCATSPAAAGEERSGRWIVVLDEGADAAAVARGHGDAHGAQVDHVFTRALRGYAARMSDQAVDRVRRDSRVRSVEPDLEVRLEPQGKPASGPTGPPAAEVVPSGIARIGSLTTPVDLTGVSVAVVDTGIAPHPDLRLGVGTNCTSGRSSTDQNGHGTHVAGTVGALDNDLGVVGVAPGVELLPVRVLDRNGSGLTSNVVCGLDWIVAQGGAVDVANLSLGFAGASAGPDDEGCTVGGALQMAVCRTVRAGTTVVVAAGNQSADTATRMPSSFSGVITVSALADSDGTFAPTATWGGTCRTEQEDRIAGFSNFGEGVELIAPGVCTLSTDMSGGYSTKSGTSMASPHVAGAAALVEGRNSAQAPAQVLATLVRVASDAWTPDTDRDAVQEPLLQITGL